MGKIFKEYIRPIADGFSAGLNNGWYNTGKPHKFGGFDITISGNIVLIPESYKMFSISEIGGNSFSGVKHLLLLERKNHLK